MPEGIGGGGVDRFELWPHRSLGPVGMAVLLGTVILGFAFVIVATSGPASWPVSILSVGTCLGLGFALWRSSRQVKAREIVEVTPRVVRITSTDGTTMSEPVEFNAYWVRVKVVTDRYVEDRIVLSEGRRRRSIGNFLSPPERRRLADALERSILVQRAMQP